MSDAIDKGTSARSEETLFAHQTERVTFEERYKEIDHWISKRRRGIDLATIEWSDIRQLILIRVSQQYHTFDPAKGPFKKWVNRVITNAIRNIWRDYLSNVSRPCITGKGGCPFNVGGNQCSKTPSGLQCSECPAYRDWEKRKGDHHAIKLAVSLDNHIQEVHSVQSDFTDIEAKKRVIDAKMKERLTKMEWRIYRLLIVKGLPEEEVAKQLGFKRKRGSSQKMYSGYQIILNAKHLFVKTAREIIEQEDLAA